MRSSSPSTRRSGRRTSRSSFVRPPSLPQRKIQPPPTPLVVQTKSFKEACATLGVDEVALRIRRIAEENGVPVVENRPLARALYAEAEIGDLIPEQFYQMIAVVLARVNKLNEARGRGFASGA